MESRSPNSKPHLAVPDFSRPGRDGAWPNGIPEWRDGLGDLTSRGLIYTSRGSRMVVPCDRSLSSQPSEEFYNEYDTGEQPGANTEPFSFSYGEHVETRSGIDYSAFVERAEECARFHHCRLAASSIAARVPFAILRRDWWAVPDTLVVVVIYFWV